MNIFHRPIQNLKNVEWGAIGWIAFWLSLLIVLVMPTQAWEGISKGVSFLFSTQFYEVKEIQNDSLYPVPVTQQVYQQLYQVMNVGKVAVWAMTFLFLLWLLFKKPCDVNQNESREGSYQ